GPRCPPVCDSTLMSSSRTSCASCGSSSSRSPLMSAGERMPSSKRFDAVVPSEKPDFICLFSSFVRPRLIIDLCLGRRFKIFHHWFTDAVAGDDLDLLLGAGKSFLTNFHKIHPFFVTNNQILKR